MKVKIFHYPDSGKAMSETPHPILMDPKRRYHPTRKFLSKAEETWTYA
jgi:hypothetical protein